MSRPGGPAEGTSAAPRIGVSVLAWLACAGLAACLAAGAAAPFLPVRMLAPLVVLLAPPFAVALAGGALLGRSVSRCASSGGGWILGASLGAGVLTTACWVSSCLTIYGPRDPETYVIDGVGLTLGAAVAWRVGRARRTGLAPDGRRATRDAGLGFALLAATFFLADALVFPSGYFLVHEGLWAAGLLALAAAVGLVLGAPLVRASSRRAAWALAFVAAGVVTLSWPLLTAPGGFRGGLARGTRRLALSGLISHRAFVAHVWRVLDRDGDGFAGVLGGADCDDGDAGAFPATGDAPTGARDCSGLVAGAPADGPRRERDADVAPARTEGAPHPPKVVLVVSFDALRCGFGEGEAPDLRDVCPTLTALAREGRLRRDLHTPATQTRWALAGLLGGPPSLARGFASRGLATVALPTCLYARQAEGVADFQTVDESWIPTGHRAPPIIALALHRAVLARAVDALAGRAPPLLLWTHEMDTHAPYLADEGSRFVLSPRRAYAADIRRTDAALGTLLRALQAAAQAPGDLWLVVTADHGEELGEHGLAFHGAQVYEETTRVPLVVWSSAPDHRAAFPPALPASLEGIASYLFAAWDGRPYVAAATARSWAPLTGARAVVSGSHKVVFHPRLGLFELFDLAADPDERHGTITAFGDEAAPAWARPLAAELLRASAPGSARYASRRN